MRESEGGRDRERGGRERAREGGREMRGREGAQERGRVGERGGRERWELSKVTNPNIRFYWHGILTTRSGPNCLEN